jgi:hypothetical protein
MRGRRLKNADSELPFLFMNCYWLSGIAAGLSFRVGAGPSAAIAVWEIVWV